MTCAAVAGYYAAALIAHSLNRDDAGRWQGYELSHLVMAIGMAAMFSPLGDPVPRLVWLLVFGMAAAWFTACLLHAGADADDAAHHHLVGNVAMLFMAARGHHQHGDAATPGRQAGSGHEGHTAAAGGGWLEGPIGTVLAVVLAGYFVVHTVRSLRALFSAPRRRSRHRRPRRDRSRLPSQAAAQPGAGRVPCGHGDGDGGHVRADAVIMTPGSGAPSRAARTGATAGVTLAAAASGHLLGSGAAVLSAPGRRVPHVVLSDFPHGSHGLLLIRRRARRRRRSLRSTR